MDFESKFNDKKDVGSAFVYFFFLKNCALSIAVD